MSSVLVGAAHVQRVGTLESEHDSILVVDTHGVLAFQIAGERVQSISRRHPQVVELRHGIAAVGGPARPHSSSARAGEDATRPDGQPSRVTPASRDFSPKKSSSAGGVLAWSSCVAALM